MSKTLVVGGNGYIGSHLKKKFSEFIYIGRKDFDLNDKNQILNFFDKINIDTCIILSAVISYDKFVDFDSEPFTTNLHGLNNLLSVLDNRTKVIYFSSMTVYDENSISPVKEDSKLLPLHSYGLSKVYAEQLVKFYSFKYLIIRIPGIYGGDRTSGLIYNTIKKMKENKSIEIDTTNLGYWETMHIDDMIDMFSELIINYNYANKSNTFNICYGEKTDIIETINFIKHTLKSNSKIDVNKEYRNFYLSNHNILKYVSQPVKYYERLQSYIKENV